MKRLVLFLGITLICCQLAICQANQNAVRPGKIWLDISHQPINAHGGGILYFQGTYYWFGEIKKGRTWLVPHSSWADYRVQAGGVSCYSSRDLLNWKREGVALAPETRDSLHELHVSKVIERPKVIYNHKTGKFVMWMHIDKEDYSYARAGVAISDRPEGPYHYQGSFRPNGEMARDMTVFRDDDGSAFLVYSSENNQTMQVCLLSDDYLRPTTTYSRILIGENREAPAMFKYANRYYLITSMCTGWDPNKALFAVASSPMGSWSLSGNPCIGPDAELTYHAQSTYVFPVEGKSNAFVFMADRWNKTNLEESRYIWLPLHIEGGKPVVEWKDQWIPGKNERGPKE